MTAPFDVTKFKKSVTKAIPGISTGFNDPTVWISTGNYCLNYLISGDFNRGIPLGKVTCFAGESGSGKSYICAGTLVRDAQRQGIFVVLLDTENSLDEGWLKPLGVDTSPGAMMRISIAMIDDVAKFMAQFMAAYKAANSDVPPRDAPSVLIVVDSLGMLLTPTDVKQFEDGDMKGDMGRGAKALKALVKNTVNLIAPYNIGFVATNHTYESQDIFSPDDKVSGGRGFVYASSILVGMKLKKLKEDADGNKIKDVRGIKAACRIIKSRYAKPFEAVDVYIPYDGGMSAYSGLFDLFVQSGSLEKVGNRYKYVSRVDGKEIKEFRKNLTDAHFDLMMSEVDYQTFAHVAPPPPADDEDDDEEE